jgi:TRAP-type C4-dicarboxylate transport system substrate-binding protein
MKSIAAILKCACRVLAVVAVAGAFGAPAAAQTAPLVMKIGTATVNDPQHEWMKVFAALVERGSTGRIKVEIYPASQLGTIPRMIEGTQFGSIQGFVGPPEFLSAVDSRFEVLSAPGLFKDIPHARRTLEDPEFDAAFLALGANKGLKGIGLFINGPAAIVTRAPVRKLADLEGKKVRVLASPLQIEQMRRLKATPVPMSLGEVLPALQQGALDGMMGGPVFTVFKFYDVAKYMYEPNHLIVTTMTVINKGWFDKLAPDLQKVVADAGVKATQDVYQYTIDYLAKQRDGWTAAGGEITQPTAAEHAQLMKLMLPIGDEVTSRKPEEKALFELLQRAAKRTE